MAEEDNYFEYFKYKLIESDNKKEAISLLYEDYLKLSPNHHIRILELENEEYDFEVEIEHNSLQIFTLGFISNKLRQNFAVLKIFNVDV